MTLQHTPQVFMAAYRETNPILRIGDLYALNDEQLQNDTKSRLAILDDIYDTTMYDGSIPIGVIMYGKPWTNPNEWTLKDWGCYTTDIIMNYTEYSRKNIAAHRIQSQWRLYRQRKAVKKIELAFLAWKHKKNFSWNPHTFEGLVYLLIDFLRIQRIPDCE